VEGCSRQDGKTDARSGLPVGEMRRGRQPWLNTEMRATTGAGGKAGDKARGKAGGMAGDKAGDTAGTDERTRTASRVETKSWPE